MQDYKKWFIGERKIVNQELSENKSWSGLPVYKLKFADNTTKEYPEAVIKRIATQKRIDLTELQKKRTKKVIQLVLSLVANGYDPKTDDNYPIAEKILEMLAEDDLNITDDVRYALETSQVTLQDVCSKVLGAISQSVAEANKVYWGIETHERTMMDVHRVIKPK